MLVANSKKRLQLTSYRLLLLCCIKIFTSNIHWARMIIDISFSRSTLTDSAKNTCPSEMSIACAWACRLHYPLIAYSTIVPDDANSYVEEESDFESSLTSVGTRKSNLEINDVKVMYIRYPDECCPKCYNDACTTWSAALQPVVCRTNLAEVENAQPGDRGTQYIRDVHHCHDPRKQRSLG